MDEELRLAIKAYDEFTSVMGRFNDELVATESAERAVAQGADEVNKAIDQLNVTIQKTGPPAEERKRRTKEQVEADRAAKEATKQHNEEVKRQAQAQREAAAAAKEHSDQIDGLLQGLGALGILSTVKRGIEGVVDAGAALDKNLGILTGLTGQAADEAQTFLMALQGQQKGVTELSTGLIELGRAGYGAEQSMTALPSLAQFAQASFMDMEKATASVSVVLKAYGKDVADAREVTDVFTMAANRSALGFDDFQLALAMSAGVSRMAGQDYRELIAVLSVLRDAGLGASDAGTSIKSAWLALMNPTDEATRVMRDLGIQVYDAQGRMRSWADIVAQVEKALAPLNEQSRNLALTTIFGSDGVRSMALSMGRGSEYIRGLTADLRASQGATAALAHEMGNTFTGAMQRTQADMEKLKITVFGDLEKAFGGVLEAVDVLIVGFNSLGPAARGVLEILVGGAGLTAAIGAVALLLRTTLIPVLTNAVAAMETAGIVAAGTGTAFSAMLGPIGLIAAAIGALVVASAAHAGAQEKERAETERKNKALVDLADQYDTLQRVIDDGSRTADEHSRAQEEQKRVMAEIEKLLPGVATEYDKHGHAVKINSEMLRDNARAAEEALMAQERLSASKAQDTMTRLQKQKAELEAKIANYKLPSYAVTDETGAAWDTRGGFPVRIKTFADLNAELAAVNQELEQAASGFVRSITVLYGGLDGKDMIGPPAGLPTLVPPAPAAAYSPDAEKLKEQAEKARTAGIRDQIDLMRHLVTMDDERVDTTAEQLAFLQQIRATLGTTRDLDEAIYKLEKEIAREPLQEQLAAFDKRRQLGHVTAREEQRFYEQLVANAEQLKLTAKEKAEYEVQAALAKREADQQLRSDLEATARYNIDLTNATTAQQIGALETIRDMYQENSAEYRRLNLEIAELQQRLQQETHDQKLAEIEFDSIVNRWTNEKKLSALREYLATAKDLTIEQQRELQQEIAQMQMQAERDQQDKLLGLYREGLEAQRRIQEQKLRDKQKFDEKEKQDEITKAANHYNNDLLAPLQLQLEAMQDQTRELERQARLQELQTSLAEKQAEIDKARSIRNRVYVERDANALLGFRLVRTYDRDKVDQLEKDKAEIEQRQAEEQAKQTRERRQESLQEQIQTLEKERDAKLKALNQELVDMRAKHGEQLEAFNEFWQDRMSTQNIQLELEKTGWQTHFNDVLAQAQKWRDDMNATLASVRAPSLNLGADLVKQLGGTVLPAPVVTPPGVSSPQAAPPAPTVNSYFYGDNHFDGVEGVEQAARAMVDGARSARRSGPSTF